jgi:hypothetical protein
MKKQHLGGMSALLALLALTVSADEYKGVNNFICASASIMECVPLDGCKAVSADAVSAPRFIEVDVKAKTLSARFADGTRASRVEHSEFVDGKLFLQGIEDGSEKERDGIGWTLAVSEDRGDMVLTGSGDNVAFVIFGACTAL